jgi:hypothetical protein
MVCTVPDTPRTHHTSRSFAMATATTKTTTEIPDFAEKIREQLLSTVRQGQQLSVDAAQTWVKAVSALPVHHLPVLPTVPGVPALPGVEAATKFGFDAAADLLTANRDFALKLAGVLTPEKQA